MPTHVAMFRGTRLFSFLSKVASTRQHSGALPNISWSKQGPNPEHCSRMSTSAELGSDIAPDSKSDPGPSSSDTVAAQRGNVGEGETSECVEVCEGQAKILFPSHNEVFYNKVQEFNRDLSIAVIKHYADNRAGKKKQRQTATNTNQHTDQGEERETLSDTQQQGENISVQNPKPGIRILEALAASGLRSIRYAHEIPQLDTVVANDFSKDAYTSICNNVEYNGLTGKVLPSWREASILMYEHREPHSKRFDVIDLDPYGSPSQFLDSTVQAVQDGGLLCVTCTDMSVLCGNNPERCYSKYGSVSLKTKYAHEMGLRIVLSCLESHANRYRRYIVPLLSCSIDFYARLFVTVHTSPKEVRRSLSKQSMVYHCTGCGSYHIQPMGKRIEEKRSTKYPAATGPVVDKNCDQCGYVFKMGGPIWSEPIHDVQFVKGLLSEVTTSPQGMYNTTERIKGLLTLVSEELPDVPLHYSLSDLMSTLHSPQPKMLAFRSAILSQGYRVSISHTDGTTIKTDAPNHVLWDILRSWVKQNPLAKTPSTTSPCAIILSKEPKIEVSFDIRPDANPPSRLLKIVRFPANPEPNWGPKARAKRKKDNPEEDLPAKRKRLQGKRSKDTDSLTKHQT